MIASLVLSAVVVYACLVLLGRQIGFTLSLAGIAGFIVVDRHHRRLVRRLLRTAQGRDPRGPHACARRCPRAWVRARRTILSADAVSFLAAAILYVLAIGDVKGFAFTLGMSTVLDLVVVFLFTHPLMAVPRPLQVVRQQPVLRSRPGRAHPPAGAAARPAAANSSVPAAGAGAGQEHLMTRDAPTRPTPDADEAVPVGTDADEQQDADAVAGGGRRAADEEALVDAGLPREGPAADGRRPDADRRVSLAHRLYNGEAGLDVVGNSRLIYKVTAVGRAAVPRRRWSSGASTSASTSRAATASGCPAPSEQLDGGPRRRRGRRRRGGHARRSSAATPSCCAPRQLDTDGGARGRRRRSPTPPGSTPDEVSPESVSADWGNDITDQALIALVGLPRRRRALPGRCGSSPRWRSARWPPWCTTSSSRPASTR